MRETALLRLVFVLWGELRRYMPSGELSDLEGEVRRAGLGWILGNLDRAEDARLTVDQLAYELGFSRSTIRNWRSRYGLKPVDGRYRWGDVQAMLAERSWRQRARHAGLT